MILLLKVDSLNIESQISQLASQFWQTYRLTCMLMCQLCTTPVHRTALNFQPVKAPEL